MESEEEKRIALDEARQQAGFNRKAVSPQESPSREPLISLSSDAPLIFSVSLAALKDLLDYVGIGSFPLIGTALTFIFVIAIAMLLFLASPTYFAGNLIMLLGGGGTEAFLFGLNFLPFLTATVLAIYIKMIIKRRGSGGSLGSIVQKTLK